MNPESVLESIASARRELAEARTIPLQHDDSEARHAVLVAVAEALIANAEAQVLVAQAMKR